MWPGSLGWLVRWRAPDHQQFADMLDRRRVELLTNCREEVLTDFTVIVIDPDLDQPVTGETGIDLLDDRFGEAVLADRDHGMQGMRTGAQGASLVGTEVEHAGYLC